MVMLHNTNEAKVCPITQKEFLMKKVMVSVAVLVATLTAGESRTATNTATENSVAAKSGTEVPKITKREAALTHQYMKRKKGMDDDLQAIVDRKKTMKSIRKNEREAKEAVERIDWCVSHEEACGKEEYIKMLKRQIIKLKEAGVDATSEEQELKRVTHKGEK